MAACAPRNGAVVSHRRRPAIRVYRKLPRDVWFLAEQEDPGRSRNGSLGDRRSYRGSDLRRKRAEDADPETRQPGEQILPVARRGHLEPRLLADLLRRGPALALAPELLSYRFGLVLDIRVPAVCGENQAGASDIGGPLDEEQQVDFVVGELPQVKPFGLRIPGTGGGHDRGRAALRGASRSVTR